MRGSWWPASNTLNRGVRRLALAAIAVLALASCATPQPAVPAAEVRTLGANSNFGRGDFGSYANLDDFRGWPHLYALGPVQHVGGEVLVIDSMPYAVEVVDGVLKVTSGWDYQPPFLVYSQVTRWREVAIPADVKSLADFEAWVATAAVENGFAEGEPFAFRIRARPVELTVSVMNRPAHAIPGDRPLREYQTTWEIGGEDTDFVGFHSLRHAGVFLGSGEKVHAHAITHDRSRAGHVQGFSLAPGGVLHLPHR